MYLTREKCGEQQKEERRKGEPVIVPGTIESLLQDVPVEDGRDQTTLVQRTARRGRRGVRERRGEMGRKRPPTVTDPSRPQVVPVPSAGHPRDRVLDKPRVGGNLSPRRGVLVLPPLPGRVVTH